MPGIEVVVFDRGEMQCTLEVDSAIEVGRQTRASESLYQEYTLPEGRKRLVVAQTSEDNVGRRHALIEPLAADRVRVTNLSNVQPIYFETPPGPPLLPSEKREVGLPQLLRLGTTRVLRLQHPGQEQGGTTSLAGATLPPGAAVGRSSRFPRLEERDAVVRREEMVEWFATAMDFLHASSANSADFYQRAARAMVEMVDLDTGRVLFLEGGEWKQRAIQVAPQLLARSFRQPSQTLLGKMLQNKKTFYESPGVMSDAPRSMAGLDSLVASPILDRNGAVIGALYGEREPRLAATPSPTGPITRLEAMVVELLARGVAAGLSRLDEERKAGSAIARFDQFFTPRLARLLAQTTGWEVPQEKQVTLLFCDIKGFTRISRELTPKELADWLRDVLDMLSECVLAEDGVLVDYVGDEVLAMWGAPEDQPDHAARACRAALAMFTGLERVDTRWCDRLGRCGEKTDLSIGMNSGKAQVGNIGSKYKFKYGAQGAAVNLGSRVQGANKRFLSHILLTSETLQALGPTPPFHIRPVGKVRLNNINDDVELFELATPDVKDPREWRDEYARALQEFISEDFRKASLTLAQWREKHRQEHEQEDATALVLLSRAVNAMIEGKAEGHPVWMLREK
jgi:adenylate cyclase